MSERVEAVVRTPHGWMALPAPEAVICTSRTDEIAHALREVELGTARSGCLAVGFVAYEAARAFGLATHVPESGLPLLWFGLFPSGTPHEYAVHRAPGAYALTHVRPTVDGSRFRAVVNDIKQRLAAGDTYQVNYTFPIEAAFQGDPEALFGDLATAQQGAYAVYLRCGRFTVCSASPELFFERIGRRLTTRPMKGTERRGLTPGDDQTRRDALRASPKQQAENVMIVDMVRNDLGRIAVTGSVHVPDLFTVERYPNVWQMTSSVTAESDATLADIFQAMHPSASVTGAPKVRTMDLLTAWEDGPRGVYTGAVGAVWPDGRAQFNVAIRTAVIDHERERATFGVGSGIVWDSDAGDEYQECLTKGLVFGASPRPFSLLETVRWSPGDGVFLLDRHLERLQRSAQYFGFSYHEDRLRRALDTAVSGQTAPLRLRWLIGPDGDVRIESAPFRRMSAPARVRLASEPVNPDQVFLYHKTTARDVYDRARQDGCDDTILWNVRGEITEATTANVVAELRGRRVTPPVSCGLLAGTFRADLLARGDIEEGVITPGDLREATSVWLINSVQEWRSAVVAWER